LNKCYINNWVLRIIIIQVCSLNQKNRSHKLFLNLWNQTLNTMFTTRLTKMNKKHKEQRNKWLGIRWLNYSSKHKTENRQMQIKHKVIKRHCKKRQKSRGLFQSFLKLNYTKITNVLIPSTSRITIKIPLHLMLIKRIICPMAITIVILAIHPVEVMYQITWEVGASKEKKMIFQWQQKSKWIQI